jgi:DNA-directed RNA polymerase specialized sigma24 family protein
MNTHDAHGLAANGRAELSSFGSSASLAAEGDGGPNELTAQKAPKSGHGKGEFRETRHKLANHSSLGPISVLPRRHDSGPADMSSIKTTTLDHRLYAWLLEPDDAKFERSFNAYFSVAFPAVVRHLTRISRWDPSQLEELAQDALLKFFERAGRGRREASQAVKQALTSLRPLNLGSFHERQVGHWSKDVSSFRDAAMRFQLTPTGDSDDGNWKAAIHALADLIPGLQRQGCHILYGVQHELRWDGTDEAPVHIPPSEADEVVDMVDTIDQDASEHFVSVKTFVMTFATETAAKTARADATVAQYPDIVSFVDGAFTIITVIPRLRVPTNGYLFEISMTLYLDECKKRGRRKRGGSGVAPCHEAQSLATDGQSDRPHPLELVSLEPESGGDGEERWDDSGSLTARDSTSSPFVSPGVDPTLQYEQEDLFEKFYEYLRKPLADATQAYEFARDSHQARAERQRLDSLAAKFARTTAVLALMGEGYTQERTAKRLGISRNQVKYIIELVQEEYTRFTAASTRASSKQTSGLGEQQSAS